MRLIDADALKNELSDKDYITYTHEYGDAIPVNWIMSAIDNAPTVDLEKLGESLRCQIRAEYGSCDDCELSCPRNEIIKLLDLERPQGECDCSDCDYFKFSQSFIENVVKFMTDYNIETVEDLTKELNHINELLGGKQ